MGKFNSHENRGGSESELYIYLPASSADASITQGLLRAVCEWIDGTNPHLNLPILYYKIRQILITTKPLIILLQKTIEYYVSLHCLQSLTGINVLFVRRLYRSSLATALIVVDCLPEILIKLPLQHLIRNLPCLFISPEEVQFFNSM